jgi:tetraacyldisaccharide 4'-kinase
MARIERHWYRTTAVSLALWPLSLLYCLMAALRRFLYRAGVLATHRVGAPVIVVGNITVGGSGKTPLVIWLARFLAERGYRPGIVTRGYGGRARHWPQAVTRDADPALVGDEPLLLARRAGCPVMAGPDRVRAAQSLLAGHGCNVVVSDDGLQHYRLARDCEIAVIDGARRFGNGLCLPAGPLRERIARLRSVDIRAVTGQSGRRGELAVTLAETGYVSSSGERADGERFRGLRVHAVAGIGNPGRFFAHLRRLGVEPIEHPFPDHHPFTGSDLVFGDDLPVIMTEKDAVKCERIATRPFWYLTIEARPDPALGEAVLKRLKEVGGG